MWPRHRFCALAILLPFFAPIAALAAEPESVTVSLWDKPNGTDGITLSRATAKAGAIEFHVANTSKALMHEFLIARWPGPINSLPYNAKKTAIREDRLPDIEGVEDMPPGTKANLRLVLNPGKYVVFCNQPGHYKAGMERRFTVTP
jgi:uncharacterized cupredoxin-like copper-binding protein